MSAQKPMLSPKELATRWGVDVKTIYEAIELGQIPAKLVGRRRKLIPTAFVEKIEQGHVVPEGEQ